MKKDQKKEEKESVRLAGMEKKIWAKSS